MSNSLPPPSPGGQPGGRPALRTRNSGRPSVGLRRLSSATSLRRLASESAQTSNASRVDSNDFASRRRSTSEPQPPQLPELRFGHIVTQQKQRRDDRSSTMPRVSEESARPEPFPSFGISDAPSNGERPNTMPPVLEEPGARTNEEAHTQDNTVDTQTPARRRRLTRNTPSVLSIGNWGRGRNRATSNTSQTSSHPDLEEDLVNLLDVIGKTILSYLGLLETNMRYHRSRSGYPLYINQRPELPFRSRSWTLDQQTSYIYPQYAAV